MIFLGIMLFVYIPGVGSISVELIGVPTRIELAILVEAVLGVLAILSLVEAVLGVLAILVEAVLGVLTKDMLGILTTAVLRV